MFFVLTVLFVRALHGNLNPVPDTEEEMTIFKFRVVYAGDIAPLYVVENCA
jgi:hypothetical protein